VPRIGTTTKGDTAIKLENALRLDTARTGYREGEWVDEGPRLRQFRTRQEMSQQRLAEFLGVKVGAVSRWETGKQRCPAWVRRVLTLGDEIAQLQTTLLVERMEAAELRRENWLLRQWKINSRH